MTTIWHQDGPLWALCPEDTLRQSNIPTKTNSLLIYPNPSIGDIVIKNTIDMVGEIHIKIANEMGVMVWEDVQSVQHSNYITLQLDLPNGMYFIQIQNANQNWTQSLVIQD
ncbi:MAG: T9SS type A sorting domain-containing protein [Bacteroidetes bacterium]|nr:T9SS type A sorting domain-containing protein [Bacteroidota bacterium]